MPDERNDSTRSDAQVAKLRADGSVATSALCLAALLLLMTGIGTTSHDLFRECEFPREVASERGWTTDIGCELEVLDNGISVRGPARLLFGLTLDLNRADQEALEVLPHIGPRRAAAIVLAREEAAFNSVAELARVRGIGAKTIEGLTGWVGVGGNE